MKDWKEHWKDMPEYVQEAQKPHAKIIIRFETEEDLQEFAKLIGQPLTNKTKSIWHPKLIRGKNSNKKYVE
jgi:ornithine carbamoyltransferase